MLEKEHGLRHLYSSSPPEKLLVSKELMDYLRHTSRDNEFNFNVELEELVKRNHDYNSSSKRAPSAAEECLIQKMKVPRAPFLEWNLNKEKRRQCNETFASFASSIKDNVTFSKQIGEEISALKDTLSNGQNNWLLYDFQVIIDQSGKVYHIDLDRYCDDCPRFHNRYSSIAREFESFLESPCGFKRRL